MKTRKVKPLRRLKNALLHSLKMKEIFFFKGGKAAILPKYGKRSIAKASHNDLRRWMVY